MILNYIVKLIIYNIFYKHLSTMLHHFVYEATLQALKSPIDKKVGAVLIYRNKIISRGYNTHRRKISTLSRSCLLCAS